MSSANSYPRCALELSPSRTLCLYVILLAGVAIAAPWFSRLPWPLVLLVDFFLLPFLPAMWRWARGEVREVVWQSDGRWLLTSRDNVHHEDANLLPGIRVSAQALLLHWRCRICGETFRAVLLGDNCDRNAMRRLRVRLYVTPDRVLFTDQSWSRDVRQLIGRLLPAKFGGTSTVSRGACASLRSG